VAFGAKRKSFLLKRLGEKNAAFTAFCVPFIYGIFCVSGESDTPKKGAHGAA
jgi:hypothetical protein